jgi:hypothetical protein
MNEKKISKDYLSLKEIISESLIRDLILFLFVFLLIIAQGWSNLLLLLFPLITYIFSVFFRIISSNKAKTEFINNLVLYYPLGLEKKHANRLFFCTIFQLILLFWIGAESFINPHLINNYSFFFYTILVFLYTFGFFWIFMDLWKFSRVEIQLSNETKEIGSILKFRNLKIISLTSFSVFLILNLINIFSFSFDTIRMLVYLPSSQILPLTFFYYGFLIISPTITIFLLIINYKTVTHFNVEQLRENIDPLPRNLQIKILESLKLVNKKVKEQLKIE